VNVVKLDVAQDVVPAELLALVAQRIDLGHLIEQVEDIGCRWLGLRDVRHECEDWSRRWRRGRRRRRRMAEVVRVRHWERDGGGSGRTKAPTVSGLNRTEDDAHENDKEVVDRVL
jgi:hypothetical protein